MDEFMDDFLNFAGFGPPFARRDVPPEKIEKFRGKLPNKLLEYWQTYGWCGYADGLFWTVDPDEWEPILSAWIGSTPFVKRDTYYVIARSAFGKLVFWGTNSGQSLKIVAPYGWAFPAFDPEAFAEDGPDLSIQLFFSATSREAYDFDDLNDMPLFEQALKELGPLDHDTMYGFVPALSLGGSASVDQLQKLDAHVHLMMLSQLTELRVMADVAEMANALKKEKL